MKKLFFVALGIMAFNVNASEKFDVNKELNGLFGGLMLKTIEKGTAQDLAKVFAAASASETGLSAKALSRGGYANSYGKRGTFLGLALSRMEYTDRDYEIIRLLIDSGADVNAKDQIRKGYEPLRIVLEVAGSGLRANSDKLAYNVLKLLLQNGADANSEQINKYLTEREDKASIVFKALEEVKKENALKVNPYEAIQGALGGPSFSSDSDADEYDVKKNVEKQNTSSSSSSSSSSSKKK